MRPVGSAIECSLHFKYSVPILLYIICIVFGRSF